jgi:hypothetical protein
VDYGWRVLDAPPGRALSGDVQQEFRRYLGEWAVAAELGGALRWSYDTSCDEVEYLIHAFYRLVTEVQSHLVTRELPRFPAQAEEFYRSLVRALLEAVAAESATCATWADDLGAFWPGIDPTERWTHPAASGSK